MTKDKGRKDSKHLKKQSSKIKYVHIMDNDKFVDSFISFINKNFNEEEHLFIVIGYLKSKGKKIEKEKNILKVRKINKNIFFLIRIFETFIIWKVLYENMSRGKKIYLHNLFDKRMILFLYIFRKFLKISNWIIWGADLYGYEKRNNKIISKPWYKIEDYVKGNMSGYITHIEGDYKLAKNWYGAKGKYFYCFMYSSNLYKETKINYKTKNELYIQVGNSADSSNNHMEILEKLKLYKNDNIKIYCILSYGDREWRKKVIDYGNKNFGKKFIPIVNFMKIEEFMKFLSEIDIAIFAHNRQQGVGNIISLLSMKKTVYLKESVTTWKTFENLGVKLKSFEKFNDLKKLDDEILERNKEIIKNRFSKQKLVKDWSEIFNG